MFIWSLLKQNTVFSLHKELKSVKPKVLGDILNTDFVLFPNIFFSKLLNERPDLAFDKTTNKISNRVPEMAICSS